MLNNSDLYFIFPSQEDINLRLHFKGEHYVE